MNITIRQATVQDAASISPLIYDAIGDIANRLTAAEDDTVILERLTDLVTRTDNRHSYLNTFIAEDENNILGIAVLYDGEKGEKLDRELERYLQQKYNSKIAIDVEAYADEFYIDTICVAEQARGMGIGTTLLQFAEKKARENHYSKLSLNVDIEKLNARKLYEKMGFSITGPFTIIGEPFHHMVKLLERE